MWLWEVVLKKCAQWSETLSLSKNLWIKETYDSGGGEGENEEVDEILRQSLAMQPWIASKTFMGQGSASQMLGLLSLTTTYSYGFFLMGFLNDYCVCAHVPWIELRHTDFCGQCLYLLRYLTNHYYLKSVFVLTPTAPWDTADQSTWMSREGRTAGGWVCFRIQEHS